MSAMTDFQNAPPFLSRNGHRASVLTVALAILLSATPVFAETPNNGSGDNSAPANLAEMLSLAQKMNPEAKAAALDAEAASARADAAGRLADPMFSVESDENQNKNGGFVPRRFGNWTYSVEQVFPLGGKRSLQREVATQEAKAVEHERRAVTDDLNERVKTVYGEYYQITQVKGITQEIRDSVQDLKKVAEKRYVQGLGEQQDVLKAEVERSKLDATLAMLEADKQKIQARLNALMNRAPTSPLTAPSELDLPKSEKLNFAALWDRAQGANAMLAAADMKAVSATTNEDLVSRNWIPDLTTKLGVVDNRPMDEGAYRGASYKAMVSINIPLSWGLKEAQSREAKAQASAAQAKRQTTQIGLQSNLHQSVSSFAQLEAVAKLLRGDTIPTAKVALRSAISSYGLGKGDYRSAIEAHHMFFEAKTELIKTEAAQNAELATIERLIGGSL